LLRAGNRISVFIALFSLLTVALLIDRLRARPGPRSRLVWLMTAVGVLLLGYADQTTGAFAPNYAALNYEYVSDGALVGQIESRLGAGAAVFQLPHVPFPEYPLGNLVSYDPVRGYLHSNDLRWSYGAMRGRPADWPVALADRPLRLVLPAVVSAGFSGLYIDGLGYGDRGKSLVADLQRTLHARATTSRDRRLFFFDLRRYARRLRATTPRAELTALRSATLYPLRIEGGQGLADVEQVGQPDDSAPQGYQPVSWRWMTTQSGTIQLVNPSPTPRSATLHVFVQNGYPTPGKLSITFPDGRRDTSAVTVAGVVFRRHVTLPPGDSFLRFTYSGPGFTDYYPQPRALVARTIVTVDDDAFTPWTKPDGITGCQLATPSNNCVYKFFPPRAERAG
jgi:phosphoglycerol transferase